MAFTLSAAVGYGDNQPVLVLIGFTVFDMFDKLISETMVITILYVFFIRLSSAFLSPDNFIIMLSVYQQIINKHFTQKKAVLLV